MRVLTKEELKTELDRIQTNNANDITIDNKDIDIVVKDKIFMSVSEYSGINSADNAINLAIKQFELENIAIEEVPVILIHFKLHPEYQMTDLSEAMDRIHEVSDDEADIVFGTSNDENISVDYVKVTVVVSYS